VNYWIFQAIPERYDLREQMREGKEVTWYATRYRSKMTPGDRVFFWLAGRKAIRGIYGWGELTSRAYSEEDWDAHGVDVRFDKVLDHHLTVKEIREHPVLQNLMILRVPQGTNFLLSDEEGETLERLTHRVQQESEGSEQT